MIIDWTKNCEKIHSTHQLTTDDKADRKILFRQEIVYIQYLTNVLKLTPTEAYIECKQLSNGVISVFSGDVEEQVSQFYRLYRKAKKNKYTNIPIGEYVKPIKIYQEEIDYLNGLDVPLWVKQYWFSMLWYYKFKVQDTPKVVFNQILRNWAMDYCTGIEDKDYSHKSAVIQRCGKKINNIPVRLVPGKRYPTYTMSFLKNSGDDFYEYSNINELKDAIHMITGKRRDHKVEKKCPVCGEYFLASTKSKTDLCPECYKKSRKDVINRNAIKYYAKKTGKT